MKNAVLIFVFLVLGMKLSFSQVAINEDASDPDPSAMLDIKTTKLGLLIPRMTFMDMYRIENPATGLLVFNTSINTFYFFNGSKWESINTIENKANLRNLHLHPSTTPTNPKKGDIYMDKELDKLRCWDGKKWQDLW